MAAWTKYEDGTWGPIQHSDGSYDIRFLLKELPEDTIRESKRLVNTEWGRECGITLQEVLQYEYEKIENGPIFEPVD